MDRANEFIELYNQVSKRLRDLTGSDNAATFTQLVERAARNDSAVRSVADRLKDYADLRNVIVHHRAYPAEIIAEPTEQTLARFRDIARRVLSPTGLIPAFQRDLDIFSSDDHLTDALKYMRDRDFSQVIVRDGDELALLTVEGITRWLEQQADEDIISVAEATVGDALACDIPDDFLIMSRNHTIYDAREAFESAIERKRPRLYAIIITHNGRRNEKPLGIVTPWDLLDE